MTARILIQHLAGSKANQTEQYPVDGFAELTIGRDPISSVAFDPQRDDAVSRHHAVISVKQGDHPSFRIADLGSRNGTFVNGEPIAAEVELLPGDIVELGKGGPKFCFDLQPRPPELLSRTRQIVPGTAGGATRLLDTADIEAAAMAAAAAGPPPPAGKQSIGRETVIGMLAIQRRRTNQTWMYVLAAALVVVITGGGGLYYYGKVKAERAAAATAAEIAKAQSENKARIASATAAMRSDIGLTPEQIIQNYGNATVKIYTQWRLFDQASGLPVYQMVRTFNVGKDQVRVPCFVKLANGTIVRWLTTDNQNQTNIPIGTGPGYQADGSGFVIDSQGFILTNKHVAAGWLVSYGDDVNDFDAVAIFNIGTPTHPHLVRLSQDEALRRSLANWRPGALSEAGNPDIIFQPGAPIPIGGVHVFEGRNDELDVQFPGSVLRIAAHLVRASDVADVAEIKIDTQQSLTTVKMADRDDVHVGEQVTVLGYPAFSAKTVALIRSTEPGQLGQKVESIPEPTVTNGIISQISKALQQEGKMLTVGTMGDVYQLTVTTGPGNSGGPVFDSSGRVIGLFTYSNRLRETVTYAIPIRAGLNLLQVQQRAAN